MSSPRFGETIERALDRLLSPFAIISGATLGILSVMVTTDVLVRAIVGRPIIGVFESAESMLVYTTFFALGYVQFKHQQLRVDILSSRARGRLGGAMLLVDAVASMFVYGAIAFFTGHEWLLAWRGGYMRRGMLEIPTTVLLSAIVVGAALVWIALIWQTIKALRQLATGIEEPTAATTPEVSI